MRTKIIVAGMGITTLILLSVSLVFSKPSFNGTTPGCGPSGGCHTTETGIFSVVAQNGLTVEVTVTGVGSGEKVAGELVDSNGNVVDMVDETNNNPFTLTAPTAGEYQVNAGYKKPQRSWDSVPINLSLTDIDLATSSRPSASFELYQNYPNPFNPETAIAFFLPRSEEIRLTIYNITGQAVRTLAEGRYPAGRHSLRWDGKNEAGQMSPSGIYFFELHGGDQKLVRKMMLAK